MDGGGEFDKELVADGVFVGKGGDVPDHASATSGVPVAVDVVCVDLSEFQIGAVESDVVQADEGECPPT